MSILNPRMLIASTLRDPIQKILVSLGIGAVGAVLLITPAFAWSGSVNGVINCANESTWTLTNSEGSESPANVSGDITISGLKDSTTVNGPNHARVTVTFSWPNSGEPDQTVSATATQDEECGPATTVPVTTVPNPTTTAPSAPTLTAAPTPTPTTAAAPRTITRALPATGSPSALLAVAGLSVLAVGSALVLVRRRGASA